MDVAEIKARSSCAFVPSDPFCLLCFTPLQPLVRELVLLAASTAVILTAQTNDIKTEHLLPLGETLLILL